MSQASSSVRRLQQIHTSLSGSSGSPYKKVFNIAVIGSGNWGTAVAKLVAENCARKPELFKPEAQMWVREEEVDGEKLTEIINTKHENVRYLPGIKLPENLVANPDLIDVAKNADILVINVPHQFLGSICDQLKHADIDFSKKVAISCLKGINLTENGVQLLCDYIDEALGLHCGVLSGANIATEVAKEKFSETTVAYPLPKNFEQGDPSPALMKELFQRPYFHVQLSADTAGVSISGALKNVIAIGAGLVEGAGWGDNAKAAVMRRGLLEMIKFSTYFFPSTNPQTFTHESAGVADLITSCAAGRNVRVGKVFIESGKPIEQVEKELLDGQSAQGIITGVEVHKLLSNKNLVKDYPMMTTIYDIVFNGLPITELPAHIQE